MYSKFYTILCCKLIAITYCLMAIEAIRGATIYDQYLYQIPLVNRSRIDDVFCNNSTTTTQPSGINITDQRPDKPNENNLFMLNTEVLFDRDPDARANTIEDGVPTPEDESIEIGASKGGSRESRRINFFRGLWNKPKISPLYLVNGTVCRFVNLMPICTTLTTTGLLPTGTNPSTSAQTEGGAQAVQFPFTNQQFANNYNQQPSRPSPILEDDSQDINVESSNVKATENSTTSTNPPTVRVQQQQTTRPMGTSNMIQGSSRPINLVSNRRPMNRLSLRRPMRQFYLNG